MSIFGGAIWLNNGIHYLDSSKVNERINKINTSNEKFALDVVIKSTPICSNLESGYCTIDNEKYIEKALVTPAIKYTPGTPDLKKVVGYCTLCNDGTFSPSCAVGRGACSYHSGVSSYDVARYVTIPGSPEIKAAPATYSYTPKSYKDSSYYIKPSTPNINDVVNLYK